MPRARFNSNARGFSLIEVVISMGLLTTVSLGVAQLFAASAKANLVGRSSTSSTAMAQQKMEQLRSLSWGFDLQGQGLPVTDTTSNLASTPPGANGRGLNPSPDGALDTNTAGYFDFLDVTGAWVGTGDTVPAGAAFVRRWAVVPLPTNPNNTLVLQVLVAPLSTEAARRTTSGPRVRLPGESLLISVKTRKAS